MRTFCGAWPALVTPFHADDTINVPVLRGLVDYLIGKDVDGFYICGNTGEGTYMPTAERKLVAETVLAQVNGRVPVIVHVGSMVARDAADLARHAQTVGAAGVSSILPPLYRDVQSLHAYFTTIADAVPDLPLLSYIFGASVDAVALMRDLLQIPAEGDHAHAGLSLWTAPPAQPSAV